VMMKSHIEWKNILIVFPFRILFLQP